MGISILVGVSKCLEGSIFFAKKCGLTKEASFYLKTEISAVNLKLPVTTSPLFILTKLRTIY